jgi:thiamine pyrophosphokinase
MDIDDERLIAWVSSSQHLYAADSGADRLLRLGFSPTVVGDFDSFTSLERATHLRLVQSSDEETTDCDKLLALAHQDGHTAITMTGTEGDLPDHVVATFSSCVASPLDVRIAFRRGIGWILKPGRRLLIDTHESQRISLLPLSPCKNVDFSGVAWPLASADLAPGSRVSISNVAVGKGATASLGSGAALLFLETDEVRW